MYCILLYCASNILYYIHQYSFCCCLSFHILLFHSASQNTMAFSFTYVTLIYVHFMANYCQVLQSVVKCRHYYTYRVHDMLQAEFMYLPLLYTTFTSDI